MHVIKQKISVTSDTVQVKGLTRFSGQTAKIIIELEDDESKSSQTQMNDAFSVINAYTGHLQIWSRDELHER